MKLELSEIRVYPVKSLRGFKRDSAFAKAKGFRYDRRWLVVDPSGRFVTQRENPRMATLITDANDGECLIRMKDGREPLKLIERPEGQTVRVVIWNDECDAIDVGDAAADWISDALGADYRLVRMPDADVRPINPKYALNGGAVSFADGYPYLLIGEASLAGLNSRLEVPLGMERFRPNLVVRGSEAFAEDKWKRIRIGDAVFRVAKPCARCVITTIDQERGERSGNEPLRTFAEFRKAEQVHPATYQDFGLARNDILFGQNLIPEDPGIRLSVGDEVEVLEES